MKTFRSRLPRAAVPALVGLLAFLCSARPFAAAVPGDPKTTVTATMDGGVTKAGNTWYEIGVDTAAPTSGIKVGFVTGQSDPQSTYLFQAATEFNALMLDASLKTGTLEFETPVAVNALSLAGASGNGAGTVTLSLHFADGTSTNLTNKVAVGDWFNNTNIVQTTAGRIDVVANSYNSVGGALATANPRVLANNLILPADVAGKQIASIDLAWTGGATTHTMIFAVSGDTNNSGHFSPIPLTPDSFDEDIIVGVAEATSNAYLQRNLVSDIPGALLTDTNLVNPWGLVASSSSPWWISDNHSGFSTLFNASSTGSIPALIVQIPPAPTDTGPANPTGIIFNNTTNFTISIGGSNPPARFIFATESGTIAAWAAGTNASLETDNSGSEAIYKGLALASAGTNTPNSFLYAANFHAGTVDVFDSSFKTVTGYPLITNGTPFTDTNLPPNFAPFNIASLGTNLYVTFAMQDTNKEDDVAGPGNGFIDVFSTSGKLLRRFPTNAALNSPWGMTLAPASFGPFGGKLLVGNFGDGRINAFDPLLGTFLGPLLGTNGTPISIKGLWALQFGNGASAGSTNTLYFTAGIPGTGQLEDHGLLGSLEFQTNQVPGVPWELLQTVNGFQDDFTSTNRNTNWVASAVNNPTPDQYQQAGGVLRVFTSAGDPNHLLFEAPGYSNAVQEVLARMRVVGFETNADQPRGGISVGVTNSAPNPSRGINLEFRDDKTDSNDSNQSERKFKFLYDGLSWGPQGLMNGTNEMGWSNNTWYWLRLRQDAKADGTNDVFGKVWPSDGVTPEPADWQMVWAYTGAHPPLSTGFAGIAGGSGNGTRPGFAQLEVDYVLIKAAGLPSIKPSFGVFGPPSNAPLFTSITKTNAAITINWFGGDALQSSTNVTGPYTTVPIPTGATTTYSPFKVSNGTTGTKFYRVQQ
ncbi:MAG TPA: TIGR03118 family protein [Verrucomicrobiae bacterium]|nr:TIGR03118 family protein [Verrucomicrobiae bacterium]